MKQRDMTKAASLNLFVLMLSACASGAFSDDPYQKRWSGLIGGAYGYADQIVAPGKYELSYVDLELEQSILFFDRRARELCENGYFIALPQYTYSNSGFSTLYTVFGEVECVDADGESVLLESVRNAVLQQKGIERTTLAHGILKGRSLQNSSSSVGSSSHHSDYPASIKETPRDEVRDDLANCAPAELLHTRYRTGYRIKNDCKIHVGVIACFYAGQNTQVNSSIWLPGENKVEEVDFYGYPGAEQAIVDGRFGVNITYCEDRDSFPGCGGNVLAPDPC